MTREVVPCAQAAHAHTNSSSRFTPGLRISVRLTKLSRAGKACRGVIEWHRPNYAIPFHAASRGDRLCDRTFRSDAGSAGTDASAVRAASGTSSGSDPAGQAARYRNVAEG